LAAAEGGIGQPPPDEGERRALRVASVRALYQQMPIALFVTVLSCGLVSAVLADAVAHVRLAAWFAATMVISVLRLGLWQQFQHSGLVAQRIRYWSAAAVGGSMVSGVLWGAGGALLVPDEFVYQLFIASVIGGMCAGVATVYASHSPAVLGFILPATVPLAWRFFVTGGRLQFVVGLLTLIFALAMCMASRRFQEWFDDTMSARLVLERRTHELHAANARLRAEIDGHKATQAMLIQSQKLEAIGRLTAGIAHDFNNILMAISGTADMIKARQDEPATGAEAIIEATRRGARLTNQLLTFARGRTLSPSRVDVNEVIGAMQQLIETTVPGNLTLELKLTTEPVIAFVDPIQIESAILNLVINARDATPSGGHVSVSTAAMTLPAPGLMLDLPPGAYATIAVADSGSGMTEDVRARAFEPFFTTKGSGRGSGLGLSQVYGLVRQSGGTTTIDSAPGLGSTVQIYLPRDPPAV
jgi:signal transduction histidine kinase